MHLHHCSPAASILLQARAARATTTRTLIGSRSEINSETRSDRKSQLLGNASDSPLPHAAPSTLIACEPSQYGCYRTIFVKMAAVMSQKAAFAGKQVASRRALRTPAGRSRVVVQASANRNLWAPGVVAPEYLNGSLAGDYGWVRIEHCNRMHPSLLSNPLAHYITGSCILLL